jgi:protein gp37
VADTTAIEWCDATFNPWIGCEKVSKGCAHCYAEADFDKRRGFAQWGPKGTRVVTSEANWKKPEKWNREAQAQGVRKRVFCASLADVFEQWPGWMTDSHGHRMFVEDFRGPWRGDVDSPLTMDTVRARLFALIRDTPHLDWLLLTKRPQAINATVARLELSWLKELPANVWMGTSVEDQETADARIPHLLNAKASVRFLSMEPLLDAVDLVRYVPNTFTGFPRGPHIGWVIVGGESGQNARPVHPDWVRSLRDQCVTARVPFFFKQWGEFATRTMMPAERVLVGKRWELGMSEAEANELVMYRVGKKNAGRLLDGCEWSELPA